ncbi:zinc finger protein ZAT9 [Ricinus communis]|uniref:zinc finger protein ZAT9 n=1 Tax=Ricinus communis TaxID=3988 RepID=UPI000772305E|nr:zinc finger protein ZAT9 [Ricinus communis]|eukprot:XP_015578908.1 zinc finger protein ZAT9 [Ricinus communis]
MEKNRICKICNRRFANGKAMGGHMRSHLAKLPLPPKPIIKVQYPSPIKSLSPSPSSSSSLNYSFTKNPIQSYRSINHELPFMSSNPAAASNDDGESETDSPKNNPTRRRSKRRRKSIEKVAESSPEQVSSISDIFNNEEDVALCLLMLSKDKRIPIKQVYEYMEEVESENEEEEDDESFDAIPMRSKGKYKCKTCKKEFRSYQALGGHKASHKKIKTHVKVEHEEGSGSGSGVGGNCVTVVDHKMFKCPFCDKMFDSGQALGGHKKVHFSYLGNAKMSAKSSHDLLDLNLPAPEDDGEVSQAEDSTICNAKAYHLRN